jgi:FMN phosphatase YigB (HAD superfamily)
MGTLTTVLLDAGGVIIDESEYEEVRAEVAVEALREVLTDYSREDYDADVQESLDCFAPRIYQYVFWKHLKHDRSLFNSTWVSYLDLWAKREPPLRLMSGIGDEILEIYKSFAIGIAGQYGPEVLELLAKHSLLDAFAHHLTQQDFAITKPDPRYYEQILRAFGVDGRECVMVGDRIDNDVVPAKRVGMKTILIRVGLHMNQTPRIPIEVPDVELGGVKGLARAVRELARNAERGSRS